MLIVHITDTDPAGAVYNFVRAMNQHTEHNVRLMATQCIPAFDFPKDIYDHFDGGDEMFALLENADVLHFHKVREDFTFTLERQRGPVEVKLADFVKGKKIVNHIHGAPFERNFPKETADAYIERKAVVLTATPDLEEIFQALGVNATYFPNCVPINDVRYLPRATDIPLTGNDGETKRLCVFQSGTNSILKNMHIIRSVMDRLAKELPVFFLHTSPESIQPQDFALRHKRISHIVFDHLEGYYGLSSLEALSMGKPTIANLSVYTRNAIRRELVYNAELPWVLAHDEASLEKAIRNLVNDEDERRRIGAQGRHFMETVWSDKAIAQKMAAFYESL